MNADQYSVGMDPMWHVTTVGITYRQWLAGMAMQGWLASWPLKDGDIPNMKELAKWSYKAADAMLDLEKEENQNGQA
jgi:hypothetical protein